MKQLLAAVGIIIILISLIAVYFTWTHVDSEAKRLKGDIQYRSYLVDDNLKESVEPNFINKSNTYLQTVVEKFTDKQRLAGVSIVNNTGKYIVSSATLPNGVTQLRQTNQIVTDAMDGDQDIGNFVTINNKKLYIYASPLHDKKSVVGSLLVIQNAGYIDSQLNDIWKSDLEKLFIQALLLSLAILILLRWIIIAPIRNLVESLQLTRKGNRNKNINKVFNNPFLGPLIKEVGNIQQNLIEARIAASEEARLRLKKFDSPWTTERLKAFVTDILKDRKIFIVSNREPYIHTKEGNTIDYHFPASGMVTAIEPIMQATGGMWIAHGSGNADKLVVDENDTIGVPPHDPLYTLKRVWLTNDEIKGFYNGFSNEGIWPLCHIAHTRPIFKKDDWKEYIKVNEKFAKTILKEIKNETSPIILVQDFHFALLPRLIKDKCPDATIGMFWHIPWPNAESFSICPWKKEILDGMLGADIIGFHTQNHCNNFINTVSRELEALIDLDQFTITKNNHGTTVKPFPISIAFSKRSSENNKIQDERSKDALKRLGVKSEYVGIGVDRLDYTKGIMERLQAIEIFLTKYPTYINKFTFIQISAPSRTDIPEYKTFASKVETEINRINNKLKNNDWKPILFLHKHHSHVAIYPLYRVANVCLVTSLHDGMNLVAKEFVAARDDEKGVLILSQFAGASRELRDALIVNPYNGEQTAEAIHTALTMRRSEQTRRMRRMRNILKSYNIYRWSAELLKTMVELG
ncbi:MAG TPA: trehalose-6-phosphate synthase [Candidatus Sulfotelmatobacter sp.]|jgi:alpha,alpha-trehalose-phosphate synthase [UDP-forming]|nr:trehalose-6-phosphate synthase [Candidatus Sulfotelmatobacter sp.]